jgi:uncharacterized protein DUF3352
MNDKGPSSFNDLSGSPEDSPTRVELEPLFSRAGAAPDGTVVADTPDTGTAASTAPSSAGPSLTMNGRWRWAVVGVTTVLVVVLLGAAFVFGQPKSGTPSTVMLYAPSNTAVLVELRQDLPGDQHNLLAQFMSHFPGFADQAAFDSKLDETVNELVKKLSEGGPKLFDYEHHFKPWFGGQVGIFSSNVNQSPGTPPSMTVVLTVRAGQRAILEEGLNPERNDGWTQSTYEGSTIWTGQFLVSNERLNLTWSDEALLISTRIEDLEAALDARADRSPGLADDQYFLQQLAPLHADRLGTFYFDGRSLAQQMRDRMNGTLGIPGASDAVLDSIAVRILGEIRAEGDHVAVTTRTERAANSHMPPLPANRSTDLAALAPRDALVYAEVRDVGQTIGFYVEQSLLPLASAGTPLDLSSVQQMLGVPPQDFFDFIIDASVSISGSAVAPQFGLIATIDDQAIATSRVAKIVSLLRAAMQFGGGVTIDEEQHGAATITVITLESAIGDAPAMSVAVSVTGGRLLIGTHDFVIGALDRTRDLSLAARQEYQAALAAGGANNAGVVFVDIAAAITAYESMIPPDMRADYSLNQKPFLAPLSHVAMISTTENGQQVNHVFLYVK